MSEAAASTSRPGTFPGALADAVSERPTGLDLAELADQVRDAWEMSGDFTAQTLARSGETIVRFARRQRAQGTPELTQVTPHACRTFVASHHSGGTAPELTTMHARRTALRMFFRTLRELGHDTGDPT